jgi:hypothetical protein
MGLTTPSDENVIVQKPYGSQAQTERAVALQEEEENAAAPLHFVIMGKAIQKHRV